MTKTKITQELSEIIFIVDDDPIQQLLLTSLLESMHYAVKAYTSPEDFLNNCPLGQRGCVISDILMPGLTGFELLAAFPKYGITMPIIFISGHADVDMAKIALKRGAIDFLEKPVKKLELLSAVQEALDRDIENQSTKTQVDLVFSRLKSLTTLEREILGLFVAGESDKELATRLNLSLFDIEASRDSILKKMGVDTFADLLRLILSSPKIHLD